jgi:hypothetical protein
MKKPRSSSSFPPHSPRHVPAAESFASVPRRSSKSRSKNQNTQTIEIGYNDALSIEFPKPSPFLKGVEIEIKIPQALLPYRKLMA